MRIGIVGPGRLGRSLAVLLDRAQHQTTLFSRGEAPVGDVILLTVPDDAIATAAAALPATASVVLHCSGSRDIDVLRPHQPAGSLHPLMTFPGLHALPDLSGVPAALAGDPQAVEVARQLAVDLGMSPFEITGDRRLYHASAVIAGNFATVLLQAATTALRQAGAPHDRAAEILLPLALQSLRNAPPEPSQALTGPVVRGDADVIAGHLKALEEAGLTEILTLYSALTDHTRTLL